MTIQAFRFGSLGQDSLTGVNTLICNSEPSKYFDFQSPSGTAYQVLSGHNFFITALSIPQNVQVVVGYGDGSAINSVTAPANWTQVTSSFEIPNQNLHQTIPVLIKIPQQKYPCGKETTGSTAMKMTAFGILVHI